MNCLNCGTEMTTNRVVTKRKHNLCEVCGSVWLDAGELDKMAFQAAGSIAYGEQKKKMHLRKRRGSARGVMIAFWKGSNSSNATMVSSPCAELPEMHAKEIEKQATSDVREFGAGPPSRMDELWGAKAPVSALIGASIFGHPAWFNLCMAPSHF